MGLYFKLKMWSEYIIPIALFVLFIATVIVCNVAIKIKEWIDASKSKNRRRTNNETNRCR